MGLTTCLVLGGGDTLHADLDAYDGPKDGVVACNDAGTEWSGELDAWVSLHPRFFALKGWRQKRAGRGYPEAKRHIGQHEAFTGNLALRKDISPDTEALESRFPGMEHNGSSGMFAAKVALVDLGFDRAVLCGIPMTVTPHFYGGDDWKSAEGFRRQWLLMPEEYRNRLSSMSGWTSILLGKPHHARSRIAH